MANSGSERMTRYELMMQILYCVKQGKTIKSDYRTSVANDVVIDDWTPHDIRTIIITPNKIVIMYYRTDTTKVFREMSVPQLLADSSDTSSLLSAIVYKNRVLSNLEEVILCTVPTRVAIPDTVVRSPVQFESMLRVLLGANTNLNTLYSTMKEKSHYLYFYGVNLSYEQLRQYSKTVIDNGITFYQAIKTSPDSKNIGVYYPPITGDNIKADYAVLKEKKGAYTLNTRFYSKDTTGKDLDIALTRCRDAYNKWLTELTLQRIQQKNVEQNKLSVAEVNEFCNHKVKSANSVDTIKENLDIVGNLLNQVDEFMHIHLSDSEAKLLNTILVNIGRGSVRAFKSSDGEVSTDNICGVPFKNIGDLESIYSDLFDKLQYVPLSLVDNQGDLKYVNIINRIGTKLYLDLSKIGKSNFDEYLTLILFTLQATYAAFLFCSYGVYGAFGNSRPILVPTIKKEIQRFVNLVELQIQQKGKYYNVLSSFFSTATIDRVKYELSEIEKDNQVNLNINSYTLLLKSTKWPNVDTTIWLDSVAENCVTFFSDNMGVDEIDEEDEYESDVDDETTEDEYESDVDDETTEDEYESDDDDDDDDEYAEDNDSNVGTLDKNSNTIENFYDDDQEFSGVDDNAEVTDQQVESTDRKVESTDTNIPSEVVPVNEQQEVHNTEEVKSTTSFDGIYVKLRDEVIQYGDNIGLTHNGKVIDSKCVFSNIQAKVMSIKKYKEKGVKLENDTLSFVDCKDEDRAICMECLDLIFTTFCYYCLYDKVHRALSFAQQLLINIYKAKTQQPLYYTKQMVQLVNSMIGVTNTDTSSGKDCLSDFAISKLYEEYTTIGIDVANNMYNNLGNVKTLLSNIATLSKER